MFFKGLIKFASYSLMIGVCIILGFLSFTGIYVLAPILPLAILAFFLSVIYEGEIYQQNITKSIQSLREPNYLKRKISEECFLEVIEDIQLIYDFFEEIEHIIEDIKNPDITNEKLQEISATRFTKAKTVIEKIKNTKIKNEIEKLLETKKTQINHYITTREVTESVSQKTVIFRDRLENIDNILNEIKESYDENIPQFFFDYVRITNLSHKYSHLNLDSDDTKRNQSLKISLTMMEKVFTEQLFPDLSKINSSSPKQQPDITDNYKKQLRTYLEDNQYQEKYKKVLELRKPWAILNKVLASICGVFMILGTSYLLVEAFTVIPFLSAIPFGILPAIIVPLAIISGSAYGIITYHALDEMLNSDIITSRIEKIKQDFKEGLSLYTGAKLLAFILLLGLAIILTICTGGTWYNVIKHTKPIFGWLSKIPTAVSGIIAGILAFGAAVFNISNSAQTSAELEEFIESEVPEDHPYNIDLYDLGPTERIEDYVPRTAIIRQNDEYYIYCCNKPGAKHDKENWELVKIETFPLKYLVKKLNFNENILYFSILNLPLYSAIKFTTKHQFQPSKENWIQFFNPARFFLLITYVPLRIVLFLGHLVSISATADRVPGIPEIITMIIGFVAEFFEDLHYFADFEHKHATNVPEVVGERLKEGGGHDHSNDLPTRILRDYLFMPFFMAAAAWHSYFSDRKKNEEGEESDEASISVNDAYAQMRGKPISAPDLKPDEILLVTNIKGHVDSEVKKHEKEIFDDEDLNKVDGSAEELLRVLTKDRSQKGFGHSNLGVFKHTHCHTHENIRNTIVLQR